MNGPRWLYLHGFASGPGSYKGRALHAHYAAQGIDLQLLDLRRPSLEHLRLSAMMDELRAALGGPRDRAVVFGSSLGALTASRVAEEDPRICALVLLAPAFRLFERWRMRLGEDGWHLHRNTDRIRRVWRLSGKRLIAGMQYFGDWEDRLLDLVTDARRQRGILALIAVGTASAGLGLGWTAESTWSFVGPSREVRYGSVPVAASVTVIRAISPRWSVMLGPEVLRTAAPTDPRLPTPPRTARVVARADLALRVAL